MPKYLRKIAALIIGGIFCFSAVSKILYWSFTIDVMRQLILNEFLATAFSLFLILIEMTISLSILFPNYWRFTGYSSAIVIFVFTIIVILGKISGRIIECPCFGKFFGAEIGTGLIVRNIVLIIWSVILVVDYNKK